MPFEIFQLKCPSCGSPHEVAASEISCGAEFTCQYCSNTSLLLNTRQLYQATGNDRICVECGGVGASDAKYCQCGAGLIRGCPNCKEITPKHNKICHRCGWPQSVVPGSPEGVKLKTAEALELLAFPDARNKARGCLVLLCSKIAAPEAVPRLVEILASGLPEESAAMRDERSLEWATEALSLCGPCAAAAVPALTQIAKGHRSADMRKSAIQALSKIDGRNSLPLFAEIARQMEKVQYIEAERNKIRDAAILALQRERMPSLQHLLSLFIVRDYPKIDASICRAIEKLGVKAMPSVLKLFFDNTPLITSTSDYSGVEGIWGTRSNIHRHTYFDNSRLLLLACSIRFAIPELESAVSRRPGIFASNESKSRYAVVCQLIKDIKSGRCDHQLALVFPGLKSRFGEQW